MIYDPTGLLLVWWGWRAEEEGWGGDEEFNSLFIVHFMSDLSLVLCLKDRTVMSEL